MTNDKIELAKQFAAKKFEAAAAKNHFLEVFDILHDEFGIDDENVLVAGLLHDTLEDTDTAPEEIRDAFSVEVASLVEEVSHPKNYNEIQKKEYYEKIKHISPGAKLIKLADFTSHLKKFIGAFTGTSDYPKHTTNGYVLKIQAFLKSCPESKAKESVFALTKELDSHIPKSGL